MPAFGALVTVLGGAVGAVSLVYAAITVGQERRRRAEKLARLREKEAQPLPREPRAEETRSERRVRELVGGFSVRDYARSEEVRDRVDAYLRGAPGFRGAGEEGKGYGRG